MIRFINLGGLLILASLCFIISGSAVPSSQYGSVLDGEVDFGIDLDSLKEGDIVMRRGRSWLSHTIASFTTNGVSHCGLVVREGEDWIVIHSISGRISEIDGVRADKLDTFMREAVPGSLWHASPRHSLDGAAVAREGRKMLERGAAFDMDFDMDDPHKIYCSELVRNAYLGSGSPDLFTYTNTGGKKFISLKTFFDPKWFEFQKISDSRDWRAK